MSEIISVGGFAPAAVGRLKALRPEPFLYRTPTDPPSNSHPRFDAELQDVLSQTRFRVARLHAIRAEIESGVFETRERLLGTVERLLDVLA